MSGLDRAKLARAAAQLNGAALLPPLVFLTDDDRVGDPVRAITSLPPNTLVILRARARARRYALAREISPVAQRRGLRWLVADDPELAVHTGAHGAHFPEKRASDISSWRARRPQWLITCAAHSLTACMRASRGGADAVLLGPAFATASHAERPPLGALKVRIIAQQAPIPVYALGGIDAHRAGRLAGAKLAGLAAIGALMDRPRMCSR